MILLIVPLHDLRPPTQIFLFKHVSRHGTVIVEALGISFGSALAPTIRSAADALGNFADLINGMSPEAKSMVISIAGGIIAFTGLSFAVSRVLTFSGMLVRTYGDIGRVMAGQTIRNKALQVAVQGSMRAFSLMRVAGLAMLGPIGLIAGGIALAAVMIYTNWDKFAPFFQNYPGHIWFLLFFRLHEPEIHFPAYPRIRSGVFRLGLG